MQRFIRSFSLLTLLLVFCMVVPLWLALAAGLAGTSITVFGLTTFTLFVLWFRATGRTRLLVAVTGLINLGAALIPTLAYMHAATQSGAQLTFNPTTYLTFSGQADISPNESITFKQVGGELLEAAVYRPDSQGIAPAVVLLHGGGWRYGHHLETGQWPRVLTDAGFTVLSIQYRLADDQRHTWQEAPEDVADAIRYIKTHAAELQIDPDQIHLLGQSAGGHLALLEAYRNRSVQSVIALYSPVDLKLDYQTSRDKSSELDFIGGPPAQYEARYEQLSPLRYVSADTPKTLLIQGTHDDLVHRSQSIILADALRQAGVDHATLILPLTGHSFENQRGGFATQLTTQRILSFLKS